MLEIHLFGQTEVRTRDGRVLGLGDFGGVKPREIFEILVLHRGRVLGKEALAALLWEGAAPDDAIATLESYVSVLRKKVTPGVPARTSAIATVNGGYRLDPAQVKVDLDEVDTLLRAAEAHHGEEALALTRRALQLARDEVLEHAPYARWAEGVRRRWAARIASAAVSGAATALDLGDPDQALTLARRALRADVLTEDSWRLVMRAHYRAGRRAEALRAYETCRRRLAEALGVQPGPQTQALFTRLLQTEPEPESSPGELTRAVAAVVSLRAGRAPARLRAGGRSARGRRAPHRRPAPPRRRPGAPSPAGTGPGRPEDAGGGALTPSPRVGAGAGVSGPRRGRSGPWTTGPSGPAAAPSRPSPSAR